MLDERWRRRFAAAEALAAGVAGLLPSRGPPAVRVPRSMIGRGLGELRGEAGPRRRRVGAPEGAGRPAPVDADPTPLGDPMAPLLWTAKSLRNLATELHGFGHRISHNLVADLPRHLGYSL